MNYIFILSVHGECFRKCCEMNVNSHMCRDKIHEIGVKVDLVPTRGVCGLQLC